MRIPNLLINHWNRLKEEGDTRSYISFANDAIIGQIVTLDIDSDRLENCLRIRASQLQNQLRRSNSSTTKEKLLQKDSLVQVLKGETLSCADIMEHDLARESAKVDFLACVAYWCLTASKLLFGCCNFLLLVISDF